MIFCKVQFIQLFPLITISLLAGQLLKSFYRTSYNIGHSQESQEFIPICRRKVHNNFHFSMHRLHLSFFLLHSPSIPPWPWQAHTSLSLHPDLDHPTSEIHILPTSWAPSTSCSTSQSHSTQYTPLHPAVPLHFLH